MGGRSCVGIESPPGDPTLCNIVCPALEDEPPPDNEINAVVKGRGNGRAGGGVGMQAENMKAWLAGAKRKEKARRDRVEGHEGSGDTCCLFLRLTQHA